MKFAIKAAMMYLITLKHLLFIIEVTLPLWCLLLLPHMSAAKSISSTFKHFLRRFLSFFFPLLHYFSLLWKSRCSKVQVTENQQYMLKGWNLIVTISWSNEKCLPGDPGHEVGPHVANGPGWGSCHLSETRTLWVSIRDFPDISNSPSTWYKSQNKYEIPPYCITFHWLYHCHIRQLLWIP